MTSMPARREAELDAEITRFGEALAAYDFVPKPEHDEALLVAYASALDAYETAKRVLAAARTAAEADVAVRQALAEGHQALADLDARREGRPVRRRSAPSCFFDTRHGPSVTEILWAPPGGTARTIRVCAADAVRLQDGDAPTAVEKARQRQQSGRARLIRPKKGAERDEQGGRHIRDRTRRAEPADRLARSRVVHLESPGPTEFSIDWNPAAPAVLVVRAVSYGERLSSTLQRLRRAAGSTRPRDVLLKAGGDFTARLPVPMTDGGDESARFRISNDAVAGAPADPLDFDVDRIPHWKAWLESADGCREFTTSISGDGWDVVRYTGSRATARLTRDSRRGEVVIERLNSRLQAVDQLFRGYRSVKDAELIMPAKPAWLAVHCQGTWSLTTSPDRPTNA
ncbi:hypothetical protein [Streptomyces sp. NPDC096311]|uniref:hypothetical protein n=1 Tax=Streptomyces sp. NPDC096311 TaxID=3366083 RepID=UPI0037FECBC3